MLRRATTITIAALVLLAACALVTASASAAERLTSPPASAAVVDVCGQRAEAQAATADVERVVSGVGTLGGCVADSTGIAHMFIEWASADDRTSGRICVDPEVRASAWRCEWDTTTLEPGSYVVRMTAIDAAGNRGTSEQAYRVEAAASSTSPDTDPDADAGGTEDSSPVDPSPTEPAPTEPAPVDPAPTEPGPGDDGAADPAPALPITPLEQLVADSLEECARLELAPGVLADRALSVAVLECMRPALELAGATGLTLDEIPVPPAVEVTFTDAESLTKARELLPDAIGGVGLELVLTPVEDTPADDASDTGDMGDTGAAGGLSAPPAR